MVNSSASSTYSRESTKSFEHFPRRLLPDDYNEFTPDWSAYASRMRAYDEAMVRGWKEEIDTLLVFAGLFSAIVTAFNIEAYHLLQDDPTQASIQVLLQISQQLASLQTTGANATTQPPSFQANTNFQPSSQSVRINALWFSSLVFSLFSALVAIIVKQWTREYMAAVSLSPRDSVRLRQHRFDCMVAWHVPEIMALLPLLLQISLVLFFVGLIDFLFLLQTTVAAIVTALIAVALVFYAATTLTPAFDIRCSYKSPQSWLFVRIKRNLVAWFYKANSRFLDISVWFSAGSTLLPNYSHWSERDHAVMANEQDALDLKALVWIHSSFTDDDTLDTLVPFIPELIPDHAAMLVYTDLASNVHLPPKTFVDLVRSRSRTCSQLLREVGTSLPKRTRKRSVHMLLKLLEYIPRDHDPAHLGALDVLWTLWEICMGACDADEQDPELYRTVLNGVAELLSEDEPFRLRRAALNLLWESAHQWTYLNCPSAVSNVISFACASRQHRLSDMFLKACAVALLLAPTLNWLDDERAPHDRQQLHALLRDLARVLQRGNADGTRYEARCVGRIAYGLALLVEKGVGVVVEPELSAALLESVELGLAGLTADEEITALEALHQACVGSGGEVDSSRGGPQSDGGSSGKAAG